MPLVSEKCPLLVLPECGAEFLLGIHHNRSLPGDRFMERFSRKKEKSHGLVVCPDCNFFTGSKKNQAAIA